MNNITENSSILNPEIIDSLYPYQIDTICRKTREYMNLNKESKCYVFNSCPKCGVLKPRIVEGGYTYDKYGHKRKHLLRCKECNKRFTEDHGQLSYYSHSDNSIWNKLIEDTIKGVSLTESAADINRHTVTVFRMRHKILNFLEQLEDKCVLNKVIEIDEKYVNEAHKGLLDAFIDDDDKKITIYHHRKKTKAGLSKDKACIVTAVQRGSDSYCKTYNMGKPSGEDIASLKSHIKSNSYIFTDGIRVYEKLLKEKHCTYKELFDYSDYDEINHLNNVNSFHSRIDEYNRKYRGVSTIYINRYNALYSLRQRYIDYDVKEILLKVLSQLRKRILYFYQRQINKEDLFDDMNILNIRNNLTSSITINKLVIDQGYKVEHVNIRSSTKGNSDMTN